MSDRDLKLLLKKLQVNGPLSEVDCEAVLQLPFTRHTVPPATYLVREGEPPKLCSVLLSGYAYRHKIVNDGGRQIVSLHIPGEALDFQGLYLDCADHNAQVLTQAELAVVPITAMRDLLDKHPAIARAVLLDMLVEASILREWIANVGRRDARTRLAHLLCEWAARPDAQGIADTNYDLPMTQEQIGDVLGLTSVHVNPSIKALEAEGLITPGKRMLGVPDIGRLRDVGGFSSLYLDLSKHAGAA